MRYVNRDAFRHLTGLGRDIADLVDYSYSRTPDSQIKRGGTLVVNATEEGNEEASFFPECQTILTSPVVNKAQIFASIIVKRGIHCEFITVPWGTIAQNNIERPNSYQVYLHRFWSPLPSGEGLKNQRYIGITKRGWRTRWSEHFSAANRGSHYRFHQSIRQWQDISHFEEHSVIAAGLSESEAMALEERLVDVETLYPLGLNMVPGGNKGLAYLRSIGVIGKSERVSPDDRQDIINRYFERASRKGLPNLLAAANWLNPSYAESVICAADDRLKPQQIRDARFLASLGQNAELVAANVGARNVAQIRRLLSGETYARVA